ncbi:MAG: DNA polymerase [Polyangiaceae bacterium]
MSDRVVIALAHNILLRGFQFASPGREALDGTPTHALFGVVQALRRAIDFKTPARALAVLDAGLSPPSALAPQVPLLPALLEALGFRVIEDEQPEDLVASYARAALEAGDDVVVVASDKRCAQLVEDRLWWYDAYKDVRYTPELVRKRFEVGPDQVAEWLALVGDDTALRGVKGLGKKSATELLETFGTVAAALAAAEGLEGRLGKALRAAREAIPAELALAHLDRQRPLPVPLDSLGYQPAPSDELQARYAELGFLELLSAAATAPELAVTVLRSQADIESLLASFGPGPVSLHALTEDPSPVRGGLAGIAFVQGAIAAYAPLMGKDALAEGPSALAAWLEDATVPKTGHDIKSLAVALLPHGITLRGVVSDSCCLSHLHEPSNYAPQDLSVIAPKILGRAVPEEDAVRGVGRARKRWAKLATPDAARYAALLAEASEAIVAALTATTDATLLEEYLALAEVLVGMEARGIACDSDDLTATAALFEHKAEAMEAEVHALAGKPFNINSTKQLGELLFGELGLTVIKKTKTGWSTATDALERIRHEHPIVPLVIRYRTLRRLTDAWVTGLTAHISSDGRVHATMHPARSFSGRVICSAPDLGRVPGKTEDMARVRHAFGVAPGHTLLSIDYRQLGLYVLAHLTKDPALVEPLREQADMHRLTAAAVLDKSPDAIDDDERQLGKVINFATFAGQGMSALALELGVTAQEAKALIDRFDQRYAVVRRFQDRQLELARSQGYIVTIAGRRWPIGALDSPDPMILGYAERLARRATHEGSVADVSRRGLLHAAHALRDAGLAAVPLLQVHDEVLFEVPDAELEQAAAVAAEAMRTAYALEVPLRVGVEAGPNWAELAPLA